MLNAVGKGFQKFAHGIVRVGDGQQLDNQAELQENNTQQRQIDRLQNFIMEKKRKKEQLLEEILRMRTKNERIQRESDKLSTEKAELAQKLKRAKEVGK